MSVQHKNCKNVTIADTWKQQPSKIITYNVQQKSDFSYKRPSTYQRILNKLPKQKLSRTIYKLAEKNVFEHFGSQIYQDCQIIFIEKNKFGTQVLFGFAKINNFQIPFKILIQNQRSRFSQKIDEGSFGSIYNFDKQLIVKKINCKWPEITNIELKIKNLQDVYEEKCIFREKMSKCITIMKQDLQGIKSNINRLKDIKKYLENKFMNQIKSVIQQYCILKFCSALQIGPTIYDTVFDIMLYEDCICFFMEKCQANICCQNSQQNMIKNLKNNLELMHFFKLIHFDIKPANILYSFNYQKFVFVDFGLSRFINKTVGFKENLTHFQGTLAYCSQQMSKIYVKKTPKYVDLYQNDWHGLELSIKELCRNRRLLLFHNQKDQCERKQKISIQQQIMMMHISQSARLKKLNQIKLKIIQKDFQYLQQKNKYVTYFSRKLKAFVKEVQLNFQQKQILAFAMKLNQDIYDSSSASQQQCGYKILLNKNKFSKSQMMQNHRKLAQKSQAYNCILSFLSRLHLILQKKLTFYFFWIEQSIEKLIKLEQIIKIYKIQSISKKLTKKKISIFSGKEIPEKLEDIIRNCCDIIFHYLNIVQSQISTFVLQHLIFLSLTSSFDFQQFIPIQNILQFSLDFYVKVQLIWILYTKQKNFNLQLQQQQEQGLFRRFFTQKQMESQERKLLLLQLQHLLKNLNQAKQKYHHFNNENQMDDIKLEILNMIEKLKDLKLTIQNLFSIQYRKYKLYHILESLSQICVDWPQINIFVRKAITQFRFFHYLFQIDEKSRIILQDESKQLNKIVDVQKPLQLVQKKKKIKYYTVEKIFKKFKQFLQGYQFFPQLYDKHILRFAPFCKLVKFDQFSLSNTCFNLEKIYFILIELYKVFKDIIPKIETKPYKQYQYYLEIYLFIFKLLQPFVPYLKNTQKIWQIYAKNHKTSKNYDLQQFYYSPKGITYISKHQQNDKNMKPSLCSLWILDNFRIEMMQLNYKQCLNNIISTLKQDIKFKIEISKNFLWKVGSEFYPTFHNFILRFILKQLIKQQEAVLFLQTLCIYYLTKVYHLNNQDIFNFPLNMCSQTILLINNYIEFFKECKYFRRQLLSKLDWSFYEQNKAITCFLIPMHLKLLELCHFEPIFLCKSSNILYQMCRVTIFSPVKTIFKYQIYCYLLLFRKKYKQKSKLFLKRLTVSTALNWEIYKPINVLKNIEKIFKQQFKNNIKNNLFEKTLQKRVAMVQNIQKNNKKRLIL